jgi:histidinol-phosphatase
VPGVHSDLDFALGLADLADSLSLPRFRALDLRVETKPDLTPVTEADQAVERALRERVSAERPGEGFLGEEFGVEGDSAVRWIVDPIDGTKNYSRGIPVFATLIALERDGNVEVAVVSAPALARRWWAARGDGAFSGPGGDPIRVSQVERVEDAVVSFTRTALRHGGAAALVARAWHARTFSDFWSHMLVAEGSVDVALDPVASVWDLAAVKLVVEEAGGRLTDVSGQRRADGGSGVSSNGLLHDEALSALAG